MTNKKLPAPLPRHWLPDATHPPGSDDSIWEDRLQRLMDAAEPGLSSLRTHGSPWWAVLGAWWRPTAVLAAAAVALVVLLPTAPASLEHPRGALALAAAVSEGEPAALWTALGSEADPVLALIVLEGEPP